MKHPAVRWGVCFVLLFLAVLALLAAAVAAGSAGLTLPQVCRALLAPGQNPLAEGIVRTIRLPRSLSALLLGGCLAVSGYLLQTYFSNPIAGPFVLGISSGAKLAVAMAMIFVLGRGRSLSSLGMIGAAFAGALAATGFILLLSLRIRRMSQLIVGGVMVGYICSAITDFAVTFAEDSNIVNLHNWSLGSFSGTSWGSVQVMALVTLLGLAACGALAKPMNAYRLGESAAQSLGVNVRLFRTALILVSSLLSACVTAFAGPISFVGIAVPQLMRALFGTGQPLVLLPACFLGGSAACLGCDLIARTLFAPTELSVSSVTAVFGAPIVLWMMLRRSAAEG